MTRRDAASPPPAVRPTAAGVASATVGLALAVAGQTLASRACMAGALAILFAHVLSLAVALVARGRADGTRGAAALAARLARLLAADEDDWNLYDRLDEHGRVVQKIAGTEVPVGRGLYVRRLHIRSWTGMFWLWRAARAEADNTPICHLPAYSEAVDTSAAGGAHAAAPAAHALDTSMVRPYERGDEARSISWRQSAHHGALMVFERAPDDQRRALLVADTAGARTEREADALAAAVLARWMRLRAASGPGAPAMQPLLTDGAVLLRDTDAVQRFCAGLMPRKKPEGDRIRARAGFVAETVRTARASDVIVVGLDGPSPLARALDDAVGAHRVVRDTVRPRAADACDSSEETSRGLPRTPLARRVAGSMLDALALYALLIAAIASLQQLFQPGLWNLAASLFAALLALESLALGVMPPARKRAARTEPRRRDPWHMARIALPALTAIALLVLGIQAARFSVAPLFSGGIEVQLAGQNTIEAPSLGESMPSPVKILLLGLWSLYYGQWVPVEVNLWGDAALALLASIIMCLLQFVVLNPRLRPLLALASLAIMGAAQLLVRHAPPFASLALCLACGIYLLARIQRPSASCGPEFAKPRRQGLLAGVVLLFICACIGIGAAALAERIERGAAGPIQTLADGPALYQSDEPLVDLSRDLARARADAALTCAALTPDGAPFEQSLYLRTRCLDTLDGSTWRDSLTRTSIDIDLGAPPSMSNYAIVEQRSSARLGSVASLITTVRLERDGMAQLPLPVETSSLSAPDKSALDALDLRWVDDEGASTAEGSTAPKGSVYVATSQCIDPITRVEELDALEVTARLVYESITAPRPLDAEPMGPQRTRAEKRYLALPAQLPKALQALRDEARRAGASAQRSAEPQLEDTLSQIAALRYLLDHFSFGGYRYDDAAAGATDGELGALDGFMRARSGYCVHYASALAVLARSLGVPARVAVGYKALPLDQGDAGGPTGATHRATSHDLHAWTEVCLDNLGWIAVDCTPPRPADAAAPSAPAPAEADVLVPLDTQGEPIDAPDADTADADGAEEKPPAAPDSIAAKIADALRRLDDSVRSLIPRLAPVLVIALALLGPHLLRRRRRLRARRLAQRADEGDARRTALALWTEIADTALDAGFTWDKADTEEDIVRMLGTAVDATAARDIDAIARGAAQARYGNAAMRPDEHAIEQLDRVCRALEAQAGRSPLARTRRFFAPRSLFASRTLRQR